MELVPIIENEDDDPIELPPGFRFHPTDEELIIHYLSPKVLDSCFSAAAITEVDLNKCEPWDLPWRAKLGEKEWYFFCVRERKYPTGLRTNRATEAGYWKATGKDKEIYRATERIGMKKTLVFYKGRAPTGEKTNWVMHEFRLDGGISCQYNHPKANRNEWVICRVFQKSPGGKKTQISGWASLSSHDNLLPTSPLPPLTDSPAHDETKSTVGEDDSHMTCFSDPVKDQKTKDDMIDNSFDNGFLPSSSTSNLSPDTTHVSLTSPKTKATESFPFAQVASQIGILQYPDYLVMHNQSIPRMLLHAKAELSKQRDLRMTGTPSSMPNHEMVLKCFGDQDYMLSSTAAGPCDTGCLWND